MSKPSFVHLRLHTEFSLFDGLLKIKSMVGRAAEQGMPALGISDHCNFYGLIKFYRACEGNGVKPIVGSDFAVAPTDPEGKPTLLTLFAMNAQGYQNITELISRAYQQGQSQGLPYVKPAWIKEYCGGVIALAVNRAI